MKLRSFWRHLLKSYIILAILPITILIMFLFVDTFQAAFSEAENQIDASAKFISSQFESQYTNLSFLSLNTISDNSFRMAAQKLSSGDLVGEQIINYRTVERALCTYAITDSIYDISFFTDNGYYATSIDNNHNYTVGFRLSKEDLANIGWIEIAQKNYGEEILLPIQEGLLPLSNGKVLALARSVRNPGKIVGYLVVEVSFDALDYIFRGITDSYDVSITSRVGEIIYETDHFPKELDSRGLIIAKKSDRNDITTVCVVRKVAIIKQAAKTMIPLVLSCVFLIVITVFGIRYYGKRLISPITALSTEMEQMTLDNLNGQANPERYQQYEEISALHNQFQRMRERLSGMMQKEIWLHTLNARERLHSLQAQINPHFLYNTLNIIGILGIEGKGDKIYDSCYKLSSIMRYSIADKNDELSSINDEIRNTRAYLELMALRYEHRISYQIDIDETLLSVNVPHLTIQPFIENIFEHAYNDDHTSIAILIEGRISDTGWIIKLSDNGSGIPPEKMEKLLNEIEEFQNKANQNDSEDKTEEYGIGISNTITRLKILFGDQFDYTIISPGDLGGTTIKLVVSGDQMKGM